MSKRNWTTIKEYEDIKFEFFEGIAKITIDRQEVYNAFRPQTNFEMLDAMNICRERGDIGVVVLTGAGDKAFCSGGDQKVKGVGGYIDDKRLFDTSEHIIVATDAGREGELIFRYLYHYKIGRASCRERV